VAANAADPKRGRLQQIFDADHASRRRFAECTLDYDAISEYRRNDTGFPLGRSSKLRPSGSLSRE
jgi:hypothetical protein